MRDAAELARGLAARITALAAELLPQGHREGHEWRCGSVAGEPGSSLGVHLAGSKAGVWSDFTSGEAGDALDLVAAARFRGDRRAAMDWARRWLGMASEAAPASGAASGGTARADVVAGADTAARQRFALRLFLSAAPSLAGTPAALYLAARGIDLAELGRQPRSLRFAAALSNRESGRAWPALLAAITDAAGAHVATHRTWLAQDARGVWCKAPLREPKMTLGPMAGGAVRLWRGASGRPLAQAPEGEAVAIAEGIETALSVVIACPELRVLAAVSLANMARVVLPGAVGTVILCADNDGENAAAARGLARAVTHFAEAGCIVRVARSPIGKDFNDALRAESVA
jgi:hypothetical protein